MSVLASVIVPVAGVGAAGVAILTYLRNRQNERDSSESKRVQIAHKRMGEGQQHLRELGWRLANPPDRHEVRGSWAAETGYSTRPLRSTASSANLCPPTQFLSWAGGVGTPPEFSARRSGIAKWWLACQEWRSSFLVPFIDWFLSTPQLPRSYGLV